MDLDSLQVKIKSNSTAAVKALDKLEAKLGSLNNTLGGLNTSKIDDLANSVGRLSMATDGINTSSQKLGAHLPKLGAGFGAVTPKARSLASTIGLLYVKFWAIIRLFKLFKKSIDFASDLVEVENVVKHTFGNMRGVIDSFAGDESRNKFGMSELTSKEIASRFQAMGTAMGIMDKQVEKAQTNVPELAKRYDSAADSVADMSVNLTKLTADLASFYNIDIAEAGEKMNSVFTGQTRPLRSFGLDLTQATLQEWALSQGMQVNMKTMTQAEKTLLRYQYVMAQTRNVQGDFERTSDSWHNSVVRLIESFKTLGGIMGGTFINAFKPLLNALNTVMNAVISTAQVISDALGFIFGWRYESGGGAAGLADDMETASDAAGGLADGTGGAADNAKKLKSYLMGIDELNVIEPDNDSGSGGGGGGGGGGGADGATADGGQWVEAKDSLARRLSEIGSLFDLGRYISNTLSSAMEGIEWDKIYEKARGFGSGLANFLNGLITPRLFGNVGKTIAGALNTALHFLDSFGETFDWKNFGKSIATGINSFFKNFDFNLAADTFNTLASGILTAAITALQETEWEEMGRKIGEFIEGIDFTTLLSNVGKLIWEAINAGISLWSGMFDKAPIETAILSIALIGPKLAPLISTIGGFVGAVSSAVGGIITVLSGGLLPITGFFTGLVDAFALAIGGAGTLHEAFVAVFGGIGTIVGGAVTVIGGGIMALIGFFSQWTEGMSPLREAIMLVGIAITAVGAIILGAPAAIAGAVAGIIALIATAALAIHEHWDQIKQFFVEGFENVKTTVSGGVQAVITWFQQLPYNIGFAVGQALTAIIEWGNNVYSTVTTKVPEIINSVVTFFSELPGKIKTGIDVFITETLPQWQNDVITFFTENVPKIIDDIVNLFKSIGEKAKTIGQNLVDGIWNGIKGGWDTLSTNISNFVGDVLKGFEDGFRIGSPSKATEEMGGYLAEGLENGINGRKDTTLGVFGTFAQSILSLFSGGSEGTGVAGINRTTFSGYGADTVNGFNEGVTTAYTETQSPIETWVKAIITWFTGDGAGEDKINKFAFDKFAHDVITSFKEAVTNYHEETKEPMDTWVKGILAWFTGESGDDDGYVTKTTWTKFAETIITAFKDTIVAKYQDTKESMETWSKNLVIWFYGDESPSAENGLGKKFYDSGVYVMEGLINGLKSKLADLREVCSEISDALDDTFEDAEEIGSPSKKWGRYGGWIIEGLTNEMDRNLNNVVASARDVTDAVDTAYKPYMPTYGNRYSVPSASVNVDSNGIVNGMSAMITSAVNGSSDTALMQQQNELLTKIANKNNNVYMDGKKTDTLLKQAQKRKGFTFRPQLGNA